MDNSSCNSAVNDHEYIELVVFSNDGQLPLTKTLGRTSNGQLRSIAAPHMAKGTAERRRLRIDSWIDEIKRLIDQMPSYQALAVGTLVSTAADKVNVTTAAKLANSPGGDAGSTPTITRTREHLTYPSDDPALILIDFDRKQMPSEVRDGIRELGGLVKALEHLVPEITKCAMVTRASTSSAVVDAATELPFGNGGGIHAYIGLIDGSDSRRALHVLQARAWLAGFGWIAMAANGRLLIRSIVDVSTAGGERLVFEGPPVLQHGSGLMLVDRPATLRAGGLLDSRVALPDLTAASQAAFEKMVASAKVAASPHAEMARREWAKTKMKEMVAADMPEVQAKAILAKISADCIDLPGSFVVEFSDSALGAVPVGDLLRDPDRFDGNPMADPFEGRGYGEQTAMFFANDGGKPIISSFAHGGQIYFLHHDLATALEAVRAAPKEAAINTAIAILKRDSWRAGYAEGLDEAETKQLLDSAADRQGPGLRREANKMWKRAQSHMPWPRPASASLPHDPNGREAVLIEQGETNRIITDWDRKLANLTPTEIYQRGTMLVRVVTLPEPTDIDDSGHAAGSTIITPCDANDLRRPLTHHVFNYRSDKDGPVKCDPPASALAALVGAAGSWTVPPLVGISRIPALQPDGTLDVTPGYNVATQLFYQPSDLHVTVPAVVPRDEALRALHVFLDPFREFRFSDERLGQSVLLAYALTAVTRLMLPTAPLFLVTSTVRGSGKGTLISMINTIVFGHDAATMPPLAGQDAENEARKRVFSLLAAATPSVHIDNVVGSIGGPVLCSMLTSREWSDRVLGVSKALTVPQRTLWAASGNNVVAEGDLVRRSIRLHLDPGVEQPEHRHFERTDPLRYVTQVRSELVSALMIMLAGYLQAGKPFPAAIAHLGSFVDWSMLVRGCCMWLGLADPVASQVELRILDPERAVIAPFYAAWNDLYGSRSMTIANAVAEMHEYETPDDGGKREAMRQAMVAIVDRRANPNKALGEWLARQKDRIVEGRAFRRTDDGDRAVARWALVSLVGENGASAGPLANNGPQ